MNFSLSEQQKKIAKNIESLCKRLDCSDLKIRDNNSQFSKNNFSILADCGLNKWLMNDDKSPAYSASELVTALESLGEFCEDTGLVFSIAAHLCACIHPLVTFGSESQIKFWMDKIQKHGLLGAHAITEPHAGSDVFSMTTHATKTKNGYVINGKKCYITNAPVADFLVVHAKTANNGNFFDFSTFIIDAKTAGVEISSTPHEKIGLRTAAMGDIVFNDVQVDSNALIGREGSGGTLFTVSMEWERTCLFALYVGLMKRQLGLTVNQCHQRKQFDKSILENQSVGHQIVDMYSRYESSRLLTYKSAWNLDREIIDPLASCIAKISVSTASVKNSLSAVELHGAIGVLDGEIERQLRNGIPSTIFSGTTNTLKNNALLKIKKMFLTKSSKGAL